MPSLARLAVCIQKIWVVCEGCGGRVVSSAEAYPLFLYGDLTRYLCAARRVGRGCVSHLIER